MQTKLSVAQKKSLIQRYQVFCLLNDAELQALAEISHEKSIPAEQIITREDEIIDKVYLIISGEAHVFKTITSQQDVKLIKVAVLTANDAIGLNETGFFSSTLFRTAMVKAASPMQVLEINVVDFQKFLSSPSILYPALKTNSEKILFMYFMNQSGLLKQFSQEQIQSIANKTYKFKEDKDSVLFRQNDKADKVYFLINGNVQIINTEYGDEHILKVIEPPQIFGESAFLVDGYRNATAKTQTDCEFFVLKVSEIKEILDKQSENALYDALGSIRIKQLRPKKIAEEIEKDDLLILKDKQGGQHRLTAKEMDIYKAIKNNDTIADLLNKQDLKQYEFSLHDLYDEILKFYHMGVIDLPIEALKKRKLALSGIRKWWQKFFGKTC